MHKPLQKLLTKNINATKLDVPTEILHVMIRMLYEVVLKKIIGNEI